jgi:2-C-methyl-D-erythritol 4-phosphate cytidylyltransferase
MGAAMPKQYLPLRGRPLIEHTLQRLVSHPAIEGIYIALAENDPWWGRTPCSSWPKVVRVNGARERSGSVLNALHALCDVAALSDWVLVHDAARPCVRREDLDLLIDTLTADPVGGLLAVPVHDTMKRSDSRGEVVETVPREHLWRAYTPQMFRLGFLRDALHAALEAHATVTDEASAVESAGHRPKLIEGHADNIKVTRPEDLELAAFFLEIQESEDANRAGL